MVLEYLLYEYIQFIAIIKIYELQITGVKMIAVCKVSIVICISL